MFCNLDAIPSFKGPGGHALLPHIRSYHRVALLPVHSTYCTRKLVYSNKLLYDRPVTFCHWSSAYSGASQRSKSRQ
ncbi:hypothetical protein PILCRDRAFT_101456 [Piloderma croceum F 1598]|uniref:Uncharacterized protein n=1 Tax=Piloderma croceum (strain F 1598) TaxID=765440 RepID=A0A0C3BZ86_PILCF|nr:hypothetical protein PILCRDRAFT_101456 [Piloderma croceum F 1598]